MQLPAREMAVAVPMQHRVRHRLAEIALSGAGRPRLETLPVTDLRLRGTWPEQLVRVLVPLAGPDLRLLIA